MQSSIEGLSQRDGFQRVSPPSPSPRPASRLQPGRARGAGCTFVLRNTSLSEIFHHVIVNKNCKAKRISWNPLASEERQEFPSKIWCKFIWVDNRTAWSDTNPLSESNGKTPMCTAHWVNVKDFEVFVWGGQCYDKPDNPHSAASCCIMPCYFLIPKNAIYFCNLLLLSLEKSTSAFHLQLHVKAGDTIFHLKYFKTSYK